MKPFYYIRTTEDFSSIEIATRIKNKIQTRYAIKLQIGYHVSNPTYRNWVPIWLIKLITKPNE